ncbi:unnamed protein product [Didymodactylos carnosus]|uniref:G-protein coupled receptors family 1 profile domain-containing protein n=1 Tax=Didymodactylos carnosus TaxID=1234261 RepID=A0A814SN93_9BILA|nr:unnamed protein product [Didymodactylos carnosus]CAF3911795.1 unnamed protein product [Didymodactylos carnosus]
MVNLSNSTLSSAAKDLNIILTLSSIQQFISRTYYIVLLIVGNIGCILNPVILLQHSLRFNSCSLYIIASSFTNIFIINFGLLTRILSYGYNIEPARYSAIYCALRTYFITLLLILSPSYIVMACIDRYALSSLNITLRKLNNRKMAKRLILIIALFWHLLSIHIFIFYYHSQDTFISCVPIETYYSIIYSAYIFVCSGLLIPSLMTIFSLLTLNNIRKSRLRVIHHENTDTIKSINSKQARLRKHNRQLLTMILIQVCMANLYGNF